MAVQTYAVYTRCNLCGVYDRDPDWCDLCGRPKESRGADRQPAHENGAPRSRPSEGPGKATGAARPV